MKSIRHKWLVAGMLLLFYGCGGSDAPSEPMSSSGDWTEVINDKSLQRYEIGREGARLRETPGPDGSVVTALPGGAEVIDLEEVSPFLTTIRLSNGRHDEPWWRVRAKSGEEGWVYGGKLQGVEQTIVLEKRLEALFTNDLVDRLAAYRRSYRAADSAEELETCYRKGLELREELIEQIDRYLDRHAGQAPPDLFWLSEVFPPFVPQLVAGKTAYYLFTDYGAWEQRAGRTAKMDDDYFFRLCIQMFPADSIEYFYPVWTIQDPLESHPREHSLLGRGIHRRLLQTVERTMKQSRRFEPEIRAIKERLINDMIHPYVTYWEEPDSIAAEIRRVLSDSIQCMTNDDRIALKVRLLQIDSSSSEIQANYKNGAPSPIQ